MENVADVILMNISLGMEGALFKTILFCRTQDKMQMTNVLTQLDEDTVLSDKKGFENHQSHHNNLSDDDVNGGQAFGEYAQDFADDITFDTEEGFIQEEEVSGPRTNQFGEATGVPRKNQFNEFISQSSSPTIDHRAAVDAEKQLTHILQNAQGDIHLVITQRGGGIKMSNNA